MISIFAKEAFLNINPSEPVKLRKKPIRAGHLMRVSSIIRGDQIAERIGARLNPKEGYENDTCIYVKPMVRPNEDFEFKGKYNYLDIIDGHNLGQVASKHKEVKVIVCSKADEAIMKSVIPNKIVYIPQHHCNFENLRRSRTEVTKVGVIGELPAFNFLPDGLDIALKSKGIELVKFSKFFSRQDIIDFYMSIDIQLVWRPYKKILSNPLKIVNASSFGVPTIALDEPAFKEVKDCYIPVKDRNDLINKLDELAKYSTFYSIYSEGGIRKSDFYHIDNVAKMYKELDGH